MSTYPELDEEIDILSAIISEQRTESRPPAPPSQDISTPKSKQLSEPSTAHRASTAEQPTSQDVPFTSMAPTTITPHHTPTLLSDPIVLPYLSNDHAFISSGPHGGCTFQENCTKVHLCQHFVQGDCMFGLKCIRQHAIEQHSRRMLLKKGLSEDIIQELPFIYRNIHQLTAAAASTEKDSFCKPADQSDNSNDICLHFIRNSCKFHMSKAAADSASCQIKSCTPPPAQPGDQLLHRLTPTRLQKGIRLTQKLDYPVYGLMRVQTFDNLSGDKKLAQNAQMYHYQHQKQQMLSLEKHRDEPKVPDSGASTDEENEDGDFTVYECPGLAPTGEMEVKNPLFDDSTLYFQKFYK
ncbi:uncharacterized protein LOC123959768 [Micropterus dolomieu]|uniref:uncharacterized protein LOC123959768 n=1 Tax=Micropterus dolomieu TaxID=147949 RepID=UPI001E8D4A93|nr:uncharacterized protein LOC123959768 [Micropterus dolomieu]